MDSIPEGYEPAETSAAKDVVQAALETALNRQGIDPYDEDRPVDLVEYASAVVEELLSKGVTIPSGLPSPFASH